MITDTPLTLGPAVKAVSLKLEDFCNGLVAQGHDPNAILAALAVLGASSLLATHGEAGAVVQMRLWVNALDLGETLPPALRH